jgi:hypothetical protein
MPAPPLISSPHRARLASAAWLIGLVWLPVLGQSPLPGPPPAAASGSGASEPIAIVPIRSGDSDTAAKVTGALEVTGNQAVMSGSGSITSGSRTTDVILPRRGVLRVCAATTVKLAEDSSLPAAGDAGLMIAMDHGAIETSFATGRSADIVLTPDFRILIGGPGSSELKVRLGRDGDTCVDNSGANAPYVVVTSLFESGLYRVQPGQRVMFEHGSLHEAIDQQNEPCGCPPPPVHTAQNEFPLAQSEGLAPAAAPKTTPQQPRGLSPQATAPLVAVGKAAPAASAPPQTPPQAASKAAPTEPAASPARAHQKRPGVFRKIGHFFRRLFGAE